MTQPTWCFARRGWWIDAIHQACRAEIRQTTSICDSRHILAALADPVACKRSYERVLGLLARGRFRASTAATLLFGAKALVKWRIADPSDAQRRAREALAGFSSRNSAAAVQPFPEPAIVWLMRRILDRWLPYVDGASINVSGRFGPGACAEHWTHVERFSRLARWCDASPHWPEVPVGHSDFDHSIARLCAVPKEELKDRLITVEPGYRTFAQQYVRSVLLESVHCGPLRGSCMDLGYTDGPAIQRRLALIASRSKRYATLDLKDASDCIPWALVQHVFPTWVVDLLMVTRSDSFVDSDGATLPVYLFAGMGNATTFVVETLFFSAYVKAVQLNAGIHGRVSVFGDDVICDSATVPYLMERHDACFKINETKSFWGQMALRESCGIFAYEGVDITAPKVSGYPNTWVGRLGMAELHAAFRACRFGYGFIMSYLIARENLLPNWPITVDAYPCISDERCEYHALPPIRRQRNLQVLQAKLPTYEPVSRRFPADDDVAKRWNLPSASTWLTAKLCGMVDGGDGLVECPDPLMGPSRFCVQDTRRHHVKFKWHRVVPSTWSSDLTRDRSTGAAHAALEGSQP